MNNEKLNILVIWQLWEYYLEKDQQIRKDITSYISENFNFDEKLISVTNSFKIPFDNQRSDKMHSRFYDIIIIARNTIDKNSWYAAVKQSSNIFEEMFCDLWFVWTCTTSKHLWQNKFLNTINKSNLKQAINEAMNRYLFKYPKRKEKFDEYIIDNKFEDYGY